MLLLCSLFLFSLFLSSSFAQAQVKAGFVENQIWFSNDPDTAGETTVISTLINNQDTKAVYGTVTFYDSNKSLGQKSATLEAHTSKVISISWKVTAGDHSIVAKFENTKEGSDKGAATTVSHSSTEAYKFSVAAPIQEPPAEKTIAATLTQPTATTADSGKSDASKTVDEVKGAAETTFTKFDNFREDTAGALSEKADEASAQVDAIKKGQLAGVSKTNEPKKESPSFLGTPFAYVKMLFYQLAYFIFSHKVVFYSLIIVIIIMFFRFLIRASR